MPRRLASQVPQTISRLMQGGFLKAPPTAYSALTEYPPVQVPPRHPYQRANHDLPEPSSSHIAAATCRRANSVKKVRTRTPSLKPKPIVYLEDKVRLQFYRDHPWEGFRPRILVEHETLQKEKLPEPEVTELAWWSTNPGPEDVIALTCHLHRHHSLSLAQAYHHSLSQYHTLRAEHETASRYALLEAQAYGATFAPPDVDGKKVDPSDLFADRLGSNSSSKSMPLHAAPETYRGFAKETQALTATAAQLAAESQALNVDGGAGAAGAGGSGEGAKRVKPSMRADSWQAGQSYARQARAILLEGTAEAFSGTRAMQQSGEGQAAAGSGPMGMPGMSQRPDSLAEWRPMFETLSSGRPAPQLTTQQQGQSQQRPASLLDQFDLGSSGSSSSSSKK